ncbi:hypothetical protein RHS04_08731 [Rhizoctonia solani]|uniref:Uncharacterized protein n=1 Tax=Rhizoctonia solani TaxID=456999 RepID=A0A8H7GZC6_9AGAM|nr:hypothetical protein RHS04_08731 [Rhizoctonia solani]
MQTCPYQCIVLYLSQGRSQLVVAHADKGEKSVMWRDHAVRDVKKMAMNAWDTITVKSAPAFVSGGTAETLRSSSAGLPKRRPEESGTHVECFARPSILGAAMTYGMTNATSSNEYSDTIGELSEEFEHLWLERYTQPITYTCSSERQPLCSRRPLEAGSGAPDISNGVARDVRCLYSGIPPSVDASRAMRDEYLAQVANEYSLTRESSSRPSLSETRDCLMSHLKLATFKSTLVDSTAGYVLLQRAYPKFLLVVATDSDLLVEQPNGSLVISFSRVISAPWDAVVWFAMYDTVSAFLLGTIPLAEYGYNCEGGSEQHRFEWIYGIPVAMLQVIAQVNSRRAGSRVALDDWQTLERRVMDWKVSFSMIKIGRSADSVDKERARADSKEAARAFAVCHPMMREYKLPLIYASQPIHRFTSAQAGLAARQEKQRIAVYEKLISFKDTRVWLYCGQQFSEFLYSLWHGVGIGGAAVTWGDYVRSRRTIVPI